MFQNVAYRPTVYRTGPLSISLLKRAQWVQQLYGVAIKFELHFQHNEKKNIQVFILVNFRPIADEKKIKQIGRIFILFVNIFFHYPHNVYFVLFFMQTS